MIVFPLVAAAVSGVFALALFRQFTQRRRLPQLAWGVALSMYAIASLAVAAGIGGEWDPTLYRTFWLFGALLNVPWLALGSIALLGNRALSLGALALVLVGAVWGFFAVLGAGLDKPALQTSQIPSGRDVFCLTTEQVEACDPARGLARAYSLPSFAIVVAIALLSSRRRDVRLPPQRVRANWLIALGVTINAVGGFALVSRGRGGPFSVVLVLSVSTMYAGFLLASRAPRESHARPAPRAGEP